MKKEVCYGLVSGLEEDLAIVPAKAYKDHRETAWLSRWLYQEVPSSSRMRSTCQKLEFISLHSFTMDDSLRTRIAFVGSITRRFVMWHLAEEFLMAEIWPLARGWEFLPISDSRTPSVVGWDR